MELLQTSRGEYFTALLAHDLRELTALDGLIRVETAVGKAAGDSHDLIDGQAVLGQPLGVADVGDAAAGL